MLFLLSTGAGSVNRQVPERHPEGPDGESTGIGRAQDRPVVVVAVAIFCMIAQITRAGPGQRWIDGGLLSRVATSGWGPHPSRSCGRH